MFCNRMVGLHQIASRTLCANSLLINSIGGTNGARQRMIHTSAMCALKEIIQREEKGVTVIEGVFVDSHHKDSLIQTTSSTETEARNCPLCRLGIHDVKHTDVLVISQFMDRKGQILPQKVTGLCFRQHKLVSLRLYQAQRCGLIQSEEHKPNERWQELNNYFGTTKTKVDFGKPKISIWEFLKKPSGKRPWE